MNSKILLVGNQIDAIKEIHELLARNKLYQIMIANDSHHAVRKLATQSMNLVVFDIDVLTDDKMALSLNLRKLGYTSPVMMLAKSVSTSVLEVTRLLPRTIVIEKPLEHKHLFGVTNKLLAGRDVPQQIHRRFYTDQKAVVEPFGGNKKFSGAMLNLSKGGAYLEVSNSSELGGIIKMTIPLNQVDRHYEVSARVVWTSQVSIWGKGQGVGVEFIHAKDVYRNLLNNL